ncbi:molecular chaperone DnaJ [Janibacter anophelis]|uniref:molecular chaperone DnaJ n=1 Tax=Janibacter anophelis TaxID=319054 RepID=UPI000DEF3220|nr:molecular chaperone DnaJ [Janibacter anophelis]
MSSYTTRPLSDRTWLRSDRARENTPFDSTWSKTLTLLEREVSALAGQHLAIGVDVTEQDLRLDGTLRARARAESPAVEVAFDSKHGPMLYRCDRYRSRYYSQGPDWQQNVRAIAKTLEALRAVDRYGAADSGEQYRGYRQLEATPASSPHDALNRLRVIAQTNDTDVPVDRLIRRAKSQAHPDRPTGSSELWAEVEALIRAVGGDR